MSLVNQCVIQMLDLIIPLFFMYFSTFQVISGWILTRNMLTTLCFPSFLLFICTAFCDSHLTKERGNKELVYQFMQDLVIF